MKSIRHHLSVTLLAALFILFSFAATGLYLFTKKTLIQQFDDSLEKKITGLSGMTDIEKVEGQMRFEFEFAEFPIPEFQPSDTPEYYEVWNQDGRVLVKSASLGSDELPRPDWNLNGPHIEDLILPDGRRGRGAVIRNLVRPEPGNEVRGYDAGNPKYQFQMALAQSRESLDQSLMALLLGFSITGVILSSGLILVVISGVGIGLNPLERIARETADMDVSDLTHRFETESLPAELIPVCQRLNGLLDRVKSALDREKRFSRDVSHELRTPIAELKTISEVTLRRLEKEHGDEKIQECLMDVLDIAQQMETLVTALLTIVREGETSAQVSNQETDLVDLVDKAHRSFSEIVTEKHLNVSLTTPENAVVSTDSNIALAILRNLFSNAFYYTPPEGSVECVVEKNGRGAEIRLTNNTADLEPSDLDQIFEPFWRKDAARSEEDRHGLGLSLVQRFSELLNVKVEASLPEEGRFQMKVRFAGDSESESKTRNSNPMTDS
ncbi:MAG: hypothetical protein KC931_00655 [Candidatus Omnitrophica bacterium]|nr:hypothetical protein [Candidatus Omnitrophota bacterium]